LCFNSFSIGDIPFWNPNYTLTHHDGMISSFILIKIQIDYSSILFKTVLILVQYWSIFIKTSNNQDFSFVEINSLALCLVDSEQDIGRSAF
jgi:hypothetical protein